MTRPPNSETRYPGYDALANWASPDWDDATREAVRERVEAVPEVRFLTDAEARTLRAAVDRVLPQPDRAEGDRVPIVPWIDRQLDTDGGEGYRYEGVPPQREAWRRALRGLDEAARAAHGADFAVLGADAQDAVLQTVADGHPEGDAWEGLDASRFFSDVLCDTVVRVYYAHPAAWSEIGYGGPASPRGHARKWTGGRDRWEPRESPHPPSTHD